MPDNPQPPLIEPSEVIHHYFERRVAPIIKAVLNQPTRSPSRIFVGEDSGGAK